MLARADAESTRSGPHARPEAKTPTMVDYVVAAPCQADDVTFYVADADAAAAARDADDGLAIADGSPDDATMCCRVQHHDVDDADGADDGCAPWVAMACCDHCVADATSAARLPGGHGDAVHDLAMPPAA